MTTALATETVSSGQLRIKWETYLHTVTFEDATQLSDTDPPCHVTYRVLVNGEPTDLTVTEWWVEGRSHDATTVTLRIPANQCVIPRADENGQCVEPGSILGFPILSPREDEWSVDADGWVEATIFVRQVFVTAAGA